MCIASVRPSLADAAHVSTQLRVEMPGRDVLVMVVLTSAWRSRRGLRKQIGMAARVGRKTPRAYATSALNCASPRYSGPSNLVAPSPAQPPVTSAPPRPAESVPAGASVLADATLSGMVYEIVSDSPRQIVGIEGVSVYCEQCGESTHNFASTDSKGIYVFP